MTAPAVSVVVPTYNHRDYVLETLGSVFAQSFVDYEVIVVNDGSPDDTAEVLRPLASAGRIRYIEQPNAGQGAARNRGLAEARGEFVAFLDDDDLWPPDKLAWQVELLRQNNEDVLVYGGHAQLYPDGRLVPDNKRGFPSGDVHRAFRVRCWMLSPGQTLIRRAALQRVAGFDASVWGADDWDLYIRLAAVGRFRYVDRTALHYRVHSNNASKRAVQHALNDLKVLRKHAGWDVPLMIRHVWLAGDYFGPNLLQAASMAENPAEARKAALLAVLFKPRMVAKPRTLCRLARCLLMGDGRLA